MTGDGTARGVSRRSMLGLLASAAAVPLLPGCSAFGDAGADGDNTGTLSLAYLGDATQQKSTNALYAEFTRKYPKIRIEANGIAAGDWGTFANTIITQIAGGKRYDVIDVATEGLQLLASKNVLEPLDRFIAKDRTYVDDYYSAIDPQLVKWTKKYASPGGKTFYIPGGYNTVVMYCNKRVFDKAGVDIPSGGWTWDEFRAAGEQIKKRTGAYLLPLGDGGFPFVDIMPWLLTNGVSTMNADWTEATLGTDRAVESAQYVKGLLADGYAPPLGGSSDAPTLFQRDKLAILPGGRWVTLDIQRLKLVDDTQIVAWPTNRQPGSPLGWDAFPIFKSSQNKRAAWTFIKWIMSEASVRYFAENGGTNVPALRDVAASGAYLDGAPDGSQTITEAIRAATPIPSPTQGAATQRAITVGWRSAITGLQPVQEALEAANAQLQPLL